MMVLASQNWYNYNNPSDILSAQHFFLNNLTSTELRKLIDALVKQSLSLEHLLAALGEIQAPATGDAHSSNPEVVLMEVDDTLTCRNVGVAANADATADVDADADADDPFMTYAAAAAAAFQ